MREYTKKCFVFISTMSLKLIENVASKSIEQSYEMAIEISFEGFSFLFVHIPEIVLLRFNMNLAEKFDNGVTDVDQNRNDQTLNSFRKKYEIH